MTGTIARRLAGAGVLVASLAAGGAVHADEASGAALASVLVTPTQTGIEVVGRIIALASGTYAGAMAIERSGTAGTVSSGQSGEVTLGAGEAGEIARVGLSMAEGDRISVTLEVMRDESVVARASSETVTAE